MNERAHRDEIFRKDAGTYFLLGLVLGVVGTVALVMVFGCSGSDGGSDPSCPTTTTVTGCVNANGQCSCNMVTVDCLQELTDVQPCPGAWGESLCDGAGRCE